MSDIHALSGAYAIHAVDDFEQAQFERHLEGCPECRAEVDSFRETAALLAQLSATEPPAELRPRVLHDVAAVRPLPPLTTRRTAARRWAPAVAAAAVIAAVGLGAAVTQPWQDDDSSRTLTASDRVLAAADAQRVALELGDARATLVRSKSVGKAVLVTEAMPPAPEGHVYELWFQSPEGDMVPAGLMPRKSDQTVLLDGDARDATGVGITVEPEGGSPKPDGELVALFELA
ncbi:anti-sigma factor [Nocardioides sp. 616]|uniref:anti-sigma factor n=1 Tax=Nocardioides sp. 616 TaxID=2268090 RepID=UPI000CE3CF0F|nr:anti-sigma factor [Nocardioides sp. 616]